jgi:hypothetical protein
MYRYDSALRDTSETPWWFVYSKLSIWLDFLRFRHKSLPVRDINAKHTFWNSIHIFRPFRCETAVLIAHKRVRNLSINMSHSLLSCWKFWHAWYSHAQEIVSSILDWDHLPVVFRLIGHVRTMNNSNPVDKFTHWKQFQSFSSESKLTQVENLVKLPTSLASMCRLSTA